MNSDLKKDLRKKIRQILKTFHENVGEKEKHSLKENLCEKITALSAYKNADIIFAYIPDKFEADCTPVILDALEKGKKVCVPKVDSESLKDGKSEMDFYFLDSSRPLEEQLETGSFGIREPKAWLEKFGDFKGQSPLGEGVAKNAAGGCSEGETSPNIFLLVPGVAFTNSGKRLGHGKGFYDIYIERIKLAGIKPFLCGICLSCQIVDEIPTDEHDALMDEVVTVN